MLLDMESRQRILLDCGSGSNGLIVFQALKKEVSGLDCLLDGGDFDALESAIVFIAGDYYSATDDTYDVFDRFVVVAD